MKFLALAASGLTLALFAPAVQANPYVRLLDIVKYRDKPGVYVMTVSIYTKDDQGRERPDSEVKYPLLVNCTNATQASFNVNTRELQIQPISKKTRVGWWCERAYGWMGN